MNPAHSTTDLVDRTPALYLCPSAHKFTRVFAADAQVPGSWDCPHCGKTAVTDSNTMPEPKSASPARSHWDMLLERRTLDDLSRMLAARVGELRDC